MELYSFESKDKRFTFVVKSEFLTKCPKPDTIEVYELMTKYKLNQYLHNPMGPAILRHKDQVKDYWIDGQLVPEEVGKRIAHNSEFKDKLDTIVEE